jgi:hypothetical protein
MYRVYNVVETKVRKILALSSALVVASCDLPQNYPKDHGYVTNSDGSVCHIQEDDFLHFTKTCGPPPYVVQQQERRSSEVEVPQQQDRYQANQNPIDLTGRVTPNNVSPQRQEFDSRGTNFTPSVLPQDQAQAPLVERPSQQAALDEQTRRDLDRLRERLSRESQPQPSFSDQRPIQEATPPAAQDRPVQESTATVQPRVRRPYTNDTVVIRPSPPVSQEPIQLAPPPKTTTPVAQAPAKLQLRLNKDQVAPNTKDRSCAVCYLLRL